MVSQSDISTELSPTVRPAKSTTFFKELLNLTSYKLGNLLGLNESVEKKYKDIVLLVQGDKPELLEQKFQSMSPHEAHVMLQYLYDQGSQFLSWVATPNMLQSLQRCGYDFTQRVEDPLFPPLFPTNSRLANNNSTSAASPQRKVSALPAPKWRHSEPILFTYLETPHNLDKIDMVITLVELGAQTDYHITRDKNLLDKAQQAVKEIQKLCASNIISIMSNPDFHLKHTALKHLDLKSVIQSVASYFYSHNILLEEFAKAPISNHKILPRLADQPHKTLFKQILQAHIQHMDKYSMAAKPQFSPGNPAFSEKNALFLRAFELLAQKNELPPTFEEAYQFVPPIMHFLNEDAASLASSLAIFKLLLAQKSTHDNIHNFIAEYKIDIQFNYMFPTEYGIVDLKPPMGLAPAQTLLIYLAVNDKKEHFQAVLECYGSEPNTLARFRQELDPWTAQKAKGTTYEKWAIQNPFFSEALASYEENLMLKTNIEPVITLQGPDSSLQLQVPSSSSSGIEKKGKFKL